MNLHQFRFVQEAARRGLNLTEAAKALHTSQPGVSKAIIELEEELGIDIFTRHGKRLKRITEPGQHVLDSIAIILREVGNLKRIGEQYSAQDSGMLSIATNLGDTKTIISHPATTSHGRLTEEHRQAAGITQGVIRLAVGLESVDDLKADLARGLALIDA